MSKTLAALTKNTDQNTLVAAGEVVELRFPQKASALSVRAGKLFHLLVAHAKEKACDDVEHTIAIADLNFSHVDMETLTDCIRELIGTQVRIAYRDEDGVLMERQGPLLIDVIRPKGTVSQGRMRYQFSPLLRLVLKHSNRWAALSRSAVLTFESRYALRLYEMMALRGGLSMKTRERFDLADLRSRLGVPADAFPRWSNFKQKVLDVAVVEVNRRSALGVSYITEKQGRRIASVTLSWAPQAAKGRGKIAADLAAVGGDARGRKNALAACKPKMAGRRLGVSFPPDGGIKFGKHRIHWKDLAETHARRLEGGGLPDLNRLAEQFRGFCARKGLPLDSVGVEKAFIGFCKKYRPPAA